MSRVCAVSVSDVALPPNLAKIESGAFEWCASLAEIVLPAGLWWIGARAFAGSGLRKASFAPGLDLGTLGIAVGALPDVQALVFTQQHA